MVRKPRCFEAGAAHSCWKPSSTPEFSRATTHGLHLHLQKSKSWEISCSTVQLTSSCAAQDVHEGDDRRGEGCVLGCSGLLSAVSRNRKEDDNNNDQAQPVVNVVDVVDHEDKAASVTATSAGERDDHQLEKGTRSGHTGSKEILTQGAWLVLIMFCAQEILTAGIASSFGVMYMEPLKQFKVTAAFKSWIYNIGRGLASMAGFLAGPLSSAFGHRIALIGLVMGPIGLAISSFATTPYLYFLSHTVLVSMGFGFSHYVLYLHMQKNFNKRRGLAAGIFAATRAGSAAMIPQLTALLAGSIGFRNMMRVMAASAVLPVVFAAVQTYNDKHKPSSSSKDSAAHTIVEADLPSSTSSSSSSIGTIEPIGPAACSAAAEGKGGKLESNLQFVMSSAAASNIIVKNKPQSRSSSPVSRFSQKCRQLKNKLSRAMDFTVLKEPSFIVFTGIDCVLSLTATNVFLALPFYSVERNFATWVPATFLSTISIAEVVGGFLLPPLFDVKRINYLYIFCGLQFLAAGLFIAIGLHVPLTAMLVICVAFGFVRAGTSGMSNVFLIRYLSIYRFPSALSAKVLFKFGIFCIGPITGHLVDITGSYSTCFFVFAGMMVLSGLLTLVLPCAKTLAEYDGHEVKV